MQLQSFVRDARGSRNWRRAAEQLAEALRAGSVDAMALAELIDDDLHRHGRDLALSDLRDRVFTETLLDPSRAAAATAVHLATRPTLAGAVEAGRRRQQCRYATLLVAARAQREIDEILEGDQQLRTRDPEFGLLLAHEVVGRGKPVPDAAEWYARWAARNGHPYARLPMRLLEIERSTPSALWTVSPSLRGGSSGRTDDHLDQPRPLGELLPGVGRQLGPGEHGPAGISWAQVQLVAFDRHPDPAIVWPDDRSQPRLHGDLAAAPISAAAALQRLTEMVADGAYGPGIDCAAGEVRLRMWETVADLLGAAPDLPIEQLASAAEGAQWFGLATTDDWFFQVAWDRWLLVDDGRRVVSLAASDTD